jgi:extracellular elastinolytic metalloproteinase
MRISDRLRGCFWAAVCAFLSILPAAAQQVDDPALKQLIVKYAGQLHISPKDAHAATISSSHRDESTGITYAYLQQRQKDLSVYNKLISIALKDNAILYSSGLFVDNIEGKTGSATPAISAEDAVKQAARFLELPSPVSLVVTEDRFAAEKKIFFNAPGIARRPVEASLVWVTSGDNKTVQLAWNINIDVVATEDWWNVRVNAQTGAFIEKDNWTVHENTATAEAPLFLSQQPGTPSFKPIELPIVQQAATPLPPNVTNAAYRVIPYPIESPNFGSFAIENEPWLKAGAGNNATTHGWHFDGTNNYNITRGNNVFAHLDVENTNVSNITNNWSDTSSTAAPSLTFVNVPDFNQQANVRINKKAGLDNLFYWNNIIHDLLYQYGLTEAAGNFQADNLGRGGVANDAVQAHGQDGLGYNNANFATPTDGTSGRMQMYLFTSAPGFNITAPAGIAGSYLAAENSLVSPNKLMNTGTMTGNVVLYNDDAGGTIHRGCAPATNAAAIAGNIAMIDGFGATGCTTYAFKIKNAQNAGARAVIVYSGNNTPLAMGGTDATITIPAISIGANTATAIINQLNAAIPVTVTMTSGIYKDGNLDNGVISHEYGHGVSNRLTGGTFNTSCLGNAEQGGEGWSDYIALMLTTNWATATVSDGTNPRTIATYDLSQSTSGAGFRRYPYSTNMAINPLTYAALNSGTSVHDNGEVWCSAIWDMTWNIIQQTNSITPNLYNSAGTGGNIIALKLVMTGLKLQPCQPGFIDARNAILAADSILYNGTYRCAIWNAFARRGMGFSARQGFSTSANDQTVATDLPAGVWFDKKMETQIVNSGNLVTITHAATCNCQVPANNYIIRDTIPTGFEYVSSTGGTLSGNVVTSGPLNFAIANETKSYSVTLRATMTGCAVDSLVNDNRDGATAGNLTPVVLSGAGTWSSSTTMAYTGAASWFAPNLSTPANFALSTDPFTPGAFSVFSFYHYYKTESPYDGGVVEIFNGTTWIDAAPYTVQNGYTTAMDASTILSGRRAFSGNGGTFIKTTLNLSSFSGQSIQVRFRMTSDNGIAVTGWYIDNILSLNGCGTFVKTGFYNSSNALLDTASYPVFVRQLIVTPLNLLDFTAVQAGQQVLLSWQTTEEVNTESFIVERSANGNSWTPIDTVAAGFSGNHAYRLTDYRPLQGSNYYRLRMVDVDQQYKYSVVRVVTFTQKDNGFVIVPNPADQRAAIHFNKIMRSPSIAVYDMAGKLVQQKKLPGNTSFTELDTRMLANGTYTVVISDEKESAAQKFSVVH